MKRTLIFIAEDDQPVSISFEKVNNLLDRYPYGVWNIKTNEVLVTSYGWDIVEMYKDNPRKLRILMDRLWKWDSDREVIIDVNVTDDNKPDQRKMIVTKELFKRVIKITNFLEQ